MRLSIYMGVAYFMIGFIPQISFGQLTLNETTWMGRDSGNSKYDVKLNFRNDTILMEYGDKLKENTISKFRAIHDTLWIWNSVLNGTCGMDTGVYLIRYSHNGQRLDLQNVHDECGFRMAFIKKPRSFEFIPGDTQPVRDWYFEDPMEDSIVGISLYKAYRLLKGKKGRTIIVAVVDNGIELDHEDLKNIIWTNTKEIAGNGIDDDHNGYIDDVHGWNFKGARDGSTLVNDQAEATRTYGLWKNRYDSIITMPSNEQEKSKWLMYQKAKKEYLDKINDPKASEEDLKYFYNLRYNPRQGVDHPEDTSEHIYGIPMGNLPSDLSHGTHVAGIIAGERNNNKGIDGIDDHVLIMPIVATTGGGDERDKDVANAIRYAVNNGAKIINLSFSKRYSPYKEMIDQAIRFAASKNVLIFHAAGNDGDDDDTSAHYPIGIYENKEKAWNFITVGWSRSKFNEHLAHPYSNYGKNNVDLFAPGSDILSSVPGNSYDEKSGTSMSTPVVSGVAALLFSYFPCLSAQQIKFIILKSSFKPDILVNRPGSNRKVAFGNLSVSGGIVNAYEAVLMAIKISANCKE